MDKAELDKKHHLYDTMKPLWDFWNAAYGGIEDLLTWGVIKKNERESDDNFNARKDKAFGFNYSKSIIDIFNFYLYTKPPERELGSLNDDTAWTLFQDDCDLYGTNWDTFLQQQVKNASITGFVGILIDRPKAATATKQDEKDKGVYAYAVSYAPEQILDWRYDRNPSNNRPRMAYLKLQDDDGRYRIWDLQKWEVYEIDGEGDVRIVDNGENTIDCIPFVFLQNVQHRKHRNLGVSDIAGIARIDASIIRNLSQGEEVIDYAAFPMMRKPYKLAGVKDDDEAGVTGILEFDPQTPESKPDWLEAKVLEPIDAILKWIERKLQEVYRESNTGGLQATEISSSAKSGVALKQEFQLLNSVLIHKANNLDEAELGCIFFWLKWQQQESLYDQIKVKRPTDFSLEDLVSDLANALSAKTLVVSPLFRKALQKRIARWMLPGAKDDEMSAIDAEIDAQKEVDIDEGMGNKNDFSAGAGDDKTLDDKEKGGAQE